MIIADVHAHIFPEALADKATVSICSFYAAELPERPACLAELMKEHEAAGITAGIVCNSAVSAHQVHHINDFIAESIQKAPQYIGFGSVFPGMDGVEEELDRMVSLGIRGVKIHPDFMKLAIDEPSGIDTYRAIAKRGLPVLFHMGDMRYDYSAPQRLLNLLRKAPDLQVIAAHFGGWGIWEEALKYPMPENVVYDTSSTTPLVAKELVLRMLDAYGIDRMMFGSDFPMWNPGEMVKQIKQLGLSECEEEKLFYGNFAKYFAR